MLGDADRRIVADLALHAVERVAETMGSIVRSAPSRLRLPTEALINDALADCMAARADQIGRQVIEQLGQPPRDRRRFWARASLAMCLFSGGFSSACAVVNAQAGAWGQVSLSATLAAMGLVIGVPKLLRVDELRP